MPGRKSSRPGAVRSDRTNPGPVRDGRDQHQHLPGSPGGRAGRADTAAAIRSFPATAPAPGRNSIPNDPAVIQYASYLDGTHDDVLRAVGGGRKLYDYRYAVNGFTAVLTPAQAAQLAQTPGVASVEPDVAVPLSTVSSPAFLGLDAPGGLWDQVGGVESAGEDVIIGMVDGGVWPEHPSFSDRTGANTNGRTAN